MAILAYGSKPVHALEHTLGGTIAKSVSKRPHNELNRHVKEQLEQRKVRWAKSNLMLQKARAPLVELLMKDKRTKASAKLFHRVHARPKLTRKKSTRTEIEPQMIAGSSLTVKVPPYDNYGQNGVGTGHGSADVFTGQYVIEVSGTGGAWAGVAVNFLATDDNPSQRFAALFDYDYFWDDWSALATAHNDGGTNIWIWGFSENRWVYQTGSLNPSWSDGTGWYEEHGSGGDGSEQSGRQSLEAYFPAFRNNWYQAWVWSSGSCDDNGTYSGASQQQIMSVPFVVFGSL